MTDELWDAAFGAHPERSVYAEAHTGTGEQRWLAAVVLGGQGHYATAATVLEGLLHNADPVLASLVGSTLASHRRQLGAHAAARVLDAAALRRLSTRRMSTRRMSTFGQEALVDVLVGLAADAIGGWRLEEARRLLERAGGSGADSWRSRVRLAWVGAEIALARGEATAAIPLAERAVELAEAAGAVRHGVKSGLVLGAALAAAGSAEAVVVLRPAFRLACEKKLLSLAWPLALLLAEALPEVRMEYRQRAARALALVIRNADSAAQEAAEGSLWLPSDLLRSGDEPGREDWPNFLTD